MAVRDRGRRQRKRAAAEATNWAASTAYYDATLDDAALYDPEPEATTQSLPPREDYSWEQAPRPYLLASELPRMSSGTAFGIVLAVAALGASATGVLAPEGFLVGIFGLAFCLVGLAAGRGDGVPGRGLAVFGMLCAGAAMGLGAAAVTHQFAWPNSHIDAVAQAHAWVAAHLSWLNL